MLTSIFFNEKPVKTLASLAKSDRFWYASMLCKEIDCTYPHMMSILRSFEGNGLVKSEGHGRIKIIKLTETGEDLAHDFENVLRRLERLDKIGKGKAEKEDVEQEETVEKEE